MTSFGSDALNDGKIDTIHDILDLIPSTVFEPGSDQVSANVSIRGMNRTMRTDEPSFAMYQDGIYVGGQISTIPKFMDMAGIEVLRGPQGGLYGRNAAAGVLKFNSAKPVDDTEGYLKATVANYDKHDIEAMVNTPLIDDTLLLRAALRYENQRDGENYNPYLGQVLDEEENLSGRVRLAWNVNEDLDLLFTYQHDDLTCTSCGNQRAITQDAVNSKFNILAANALNAGFIVGLDENTLDQNSRNTENFVDTTQDLFIVEGNYTVNSGTFTGILGHRKVDVTTSEDLDLTILDDSWSQRWIEQSSTYGEFRFASDSDGPLNYVAGVNYFTEDRTYDYDQLVYLNIPFPIVGLDVGAGPVVAGQGWAG